MTARKDKKLRALEEYEREQRGTVSEMVGSIFLDLISFLSSC